MANKSEKLSMCMITQYYQSEYWDSTKWDKKIIDDADLETILKKIGEMLHKAGGKLEAIYGITHDRDSREVWDDRLNDYVVELKPKHGHFVVKFKDRDNGLSIKAISEAIGIEPQYVEKAGRGRHAYNNMLAYLIHIKDRDKFQYLPSDVLSYVPDGVPKYQEIYAENKKKWELGASMKTTQKAISPESVDDLYLRVINGEVTFQEIQLTDIYYQIYAQNITKFDKGFEAYRNRRMAIAADRMNKGELKTKVLYIQGEARTGKSRFAKELAHAFVNVAKQKGKRWEWGAGGAVNPTEQYTGQEVFVMNDLREHSMRPEDWLRLLDPENAEAIYGRYKSKVVCPEWIIITCHMDVYDFFNSVRDQSKHFEPLDQFIGRLMARVVVLGHDDVRMYPKIEYDKEMYMSRDNKPVTYNDGYQAEKLRFGFTDKYVPLPNATNGDGMNKLAEFLLSNGNVVSLVENNGLEDEK